MQGEFRGDVTRDTFHPSKHFRRVLSQQGRVQLEADWNEQAAILLHYLQALAVDLIGDHGGPVDNWGLEIKDVALPNDFQIGAGHYYVDGILLENEAADLTYTRQPGYPFPDASALESGKTYLVYGDGWERHISYIEDEKLREVALGGPDSATRAQVVWQVKATDKKPDESPFPTTKDEVEAKWNQWVEQWQPPDRGKLKAKGKEDPTKDTDPCITAPDARYRGAENQLYRVEIHKRGKAWSGVVKDGKPEGNAEHAATFKWSRDNSSVTFPIRALQGNIATLEHLGRDSRLSLKPGDWVEIVDDDSALRGKGGPFVQVDQVDLISTTVVFKAPSGVVVPTYAGNGSTTKHPLLRRWDHQEGDPTRGEAKLGADGALLVEEDKWLTLEDGVQIQFQKGGNYRSGDYWLIPARTATGDVEWPQEKGATGAPIPAARPPHGVKHHYAPLAIITLNGGGRVTVKVDCRRKIKQLWE